MQKFEFRSPIWFCLIDKVSKDATRWLGCCEFQQHLKHVTYRSALNLCERESQLPTGLADEGPCEHLPLLGAEKRPQWILVIVQGLLQLDLQVESVTFVQLVDLGAKLHFEGILKVKLCKSPLCQERWWVL